MKFKSLKGRWFLKDKDQDGKNLSCKENKEEVCIVRDTITQVSLKGKTNNNKDTTETFAFRVTAIMDEYYNKWFMSEEEK